MAKTFQLHPDHPECNCWGCGNNCPERYMRCGKSRTQHPVELLGDDWMLYGDWGFEISVISGSEQRV